jgi:hypothetical protein
MAQILQSFIAKERFGQTVHSADSRDQRALGFMLWLPITLFLIGSSAAFYWAGFRHVDIQWHSRAQDCACLLGVYLLAKGLRIDFVKTTINAVCQNAVIAISAMMLTYVSATSSRPLIDAQLLGADQFMGYDWKAYAGFLADHQTIARIITASYQFIFTLPIIVIASLAATKRIRLLEKFILAGMISLLTTAALFSLFPATTAWTYLGLSDTEVASFQYLTLSSDNWINELIQIREGRTRDLRDLHGLGLTAFPSFHCTAALLFIWATWNVVLIRILMVIANLLMLMATPATGGHYVVDLIAGAVVMAIGVIMVEWLYPRLVDHAAGFQSRFELADNLSKGIRAGRTAGKTG